MPTIQEARNTVKDAMFATGDVLAELNKARKALREDEPLVQPADLCLDEFALAVCEAKKGLQVISTILGNIDVELSDTKRSG